MASEPTTEFERELYELLRGANLLSHYKGRLVFGTKDMKDIHVRPSRRFFFWMMSKKDKKKWNKMSLEWLNDRALRSGKVIPTAEPDMEQELSTRYEDIRTEIHMSIEERDDLRVEECLYTAPQLTLWLCPKTGQSALHRAVEKNAFKIYALLVSHKCRFLNNAEKSCLDCLSLLQRGELQRQTSFMDEYVNQHIAYLNSKLHGLSEPFKDRMNDLYVKLDSISLVRTILMVVATAEHLVILCDEERNIVQLMLQSQENEVITNWKTQEIYIGSDRQEEQVLGLFARELSSLSLHLVFHNNGKPYRSSDKLNEELYQQIVDDLKKTQAELRRFSRNAFFRDDEAEVIVGVPEVLSYYNSGCEGDALLKKEAKELYRFFKYEVVSEIEVYIEDTMLRREAEEITKYNARLGREWKPISGVGCRHKFHNALKYDDLPDVAISILTAPILVFLEGIVYELLCYQTNLHLRARQWDSGSHRVLTGNKCNFVTISCEGRSDIQEILEVLHEVREVYGAKVLLLVETENAEHYVTTVKRNAYFEKNHAVKGIDGACFTNVTGDWKNELLKETNVHVHAFDGSFFCNKVLDLRSFVGILDEDTFVKLCKKGAILIGQARQSSSQEVFENKYLDKCRETTAPVHYIRPGFERAVTVDLQNVWLGDMNEAFAICTLSSKEAIVPLLPREETLYGMDELKKFRKFVLLNDPTEYEDLTMSTDYKNKRVHLLRFDAADGRFSWIKSNGPSSHLPILRTERLDIRPLLKAGETIVVCGTPGMGKTTMARRLLNRMEREDNKLWLLYVDLFNEERLGNLKDPGTDLKQLAAICGVKDDGFEYALFKDSIHTESPLTIFIALDAYDAINERARKVTLKLARYLAKRTRVHVLLFSRTVFKTSLQDALHTIPYEVPPLSAEDKKTFLEKWRQNKSSCAVHNKVSQHSVSAPDLHGLLAAKCTKALKTPTGLRIIAELLSIDDSERCSELIQAFIKSSANVTFLDILQLYVENKYVGYTEENNKADVNAGIVPHHGMESKQQFLGKYSLLALKFIFEEEVRAQLLNEKRLAGLEPHGKLIKDACEHIRGHGIVEAVNNGLPVFSQRILAEFLAAGFLFRRVRSSTTKNARLFDLLCGMYADDAYDELLRFFDGLGAASYPLHSAVVDGDLEYMTRYQNDPLMQKENRMHARDKLGRTALHVIALRPEEDVLDVLGSIVAQCESKEEINVALLRRDKFGMTPLMYADKFNRWNVLNLFCSWISKDIDWERQMPDALNSVMSEKELQKSLLHECVRRKLKYLLNVLLAYFCRMPCERSPPKQKKASSGAHLKTLPGGRTLEEWETPQRNRTNHAHIDCIRDEDGRTLLFYADKEDVFKILLPYSNVKAVDKRKITLLHFNAFCGRVGVVTSSFLLFCKDVGAKYDRAEGWCADTVIGTAIDNERHGVVKFLLPHSRSLYKVFCSPSSAEMVATLIPHLHFFWPMQCTPLDVCDDNFSFDVLTRLLPYCDINYTDPWTNHLMFRVVDPITPTMSAQLRKKTASKWRALKLSLLHMNFTTRKTRDETLLHNWVDNGNEEMIKHLLPHADIKVKDWHGRTPLCLAVELGRAEAVEVLCQWANETTESKWLNIERAIGNKYSTTRFMAMTSSGSRSFNYIPKRLKGKPVSDFLSIVNELVTSKCDTQIDTENLSRLERLYLRRMRDQAAMIRSGYMYRID